MAQLPIDEALNRFKDNEGRFDKFVNDEGGYISSSGQNVESIPAFLARQEQEINQIPEIVATNLAASVAAKTAAEAARDAAIVNSTMYPNEATGRAAVADGAYFKVIGTGDVACYEYRRTNSSTSTLVATYPSKGYVDGGKGMAGTANTASGAGYDTYNPDAPGCSIATSRPGVTIAKGKVGYPITVTKVVTTGSTTWFGVHIKISYSALSDLNKLLNLNALTVAGVGPNYAMIITSATGDWEPANSPVPTSVAASMEGGVGINLYDSIMASSYASVYQARTDLYILLAYYNATTSVVDAATATWTLRPRFEGSLDVIANKVTAALRDNLRADFVYVNKAPLASISAFKQYDESTATIDHIYTYSFDGSTTVNIGYDATLLNTQGYTFSCAKIFNDYATEAADKKYCVFLKSDNKETTVRVLFTSGPGWASQNESIGKCQDTTVTLNAANNYRATVDIDYSTMAGFYAAANRAQVGYFLIVYEGVVTPQAIKFSTYCFNTTILSQDGVMENSFVSTLESNISSLSKDIAQLQNEISASSITCWGDSLTAGGGWTTTLQSLSGMTVYNGGTGGETSRTIMARQGGDVMVINNITIPADTSQVLIADRDIDGGIKTQFGQTVTPLLQGGEHVNPCKIGDIIGTLTWTGSSHSDMTGNWVFARSVAGSAVQITRPTAIRTDFDMNKNGGIQIIFMGQNGGYTSNDDLIWQHRQMIEHSGAKHTIILGFSSGSAATRADYETAMKAAFGRYFISLREYLATPIYTNDVITSCYGLQDAGLTPTQSDLDAIETGTVPPQLLVDAVHYTTACKTVIGNMLYAKMRDLNLF